jgi:Phosphodiester glycosidase
MTARALPSGRSLPRAYERFRLALPDGASTTVHLASFARTAMRARVVSLGHGRSLLSSTRERGWRDAIVGGFFVRPDGIPLGELRIGGRVQPGVAFAVPWDRLRSCVHVSGHAIRITPRPEIDPEPSGDLLQAGPLLVRGGVSIIDATRDAEGFSAAAHQFDSDITRGRYPRAALALAGDRVLALVCDGRSEVDAGLSLTELADVLTDLGADTAINLDGGGSASLVYGGRLRNRPREEHGIEILGGRPIATAIVFEPAAARAIHRHLPRRWLCSTGSRSS